jgi:PAS domain S-box-containing protein
MKNNNESKELVLHYFKTLVEVSRESFLILDDKLQVILANPVFYQNFRVEPAQTENRLLYDLGNGQWNIPELRKLLEEILPEKKAVKDFEVKHVFETIGEKTILLNARQLDIDTVQMIVLALEDISVRKELEIKLAVIAVEKEKIRSDLAITAQKLAATADEKEDVRKKLEVTAEQLKEKAEALAIIAREKENTKLKLEVTAEGLAATAEQKEEIRGKLAITAKELATYTTGIEAKAAVDSSGESSETNAQNEAILASIGDGLVMVGIEGNIIYVNKSFEEMLGWKMQEVVGKSMVEVVPTEDINRILVQFKEEILSQVLNGEKFVADLTNPFYFIRRDKSRFPVSIIVTPVALGEKIIGAVETFRDITHEKEITESLATQVKKLQHMNDLMVGRELRMVELKKENSELGKVGSHP